MRYDYFTQFKVYMLCVYSARVGRTHYEYQIPNLKLFRWKLRLKSSESQIWAAGNHGPI